jgi:hypothetical protein
MIHLRCPSCGKGLTAIETTALTAPWRKIDHHRRMRETRQCSACETNWEVVVRMAPVGEVQSLRSIPDNGELLIKIAEGWSE